MRLDSFVDISLFVGILIVLIILHELGHMIVAKRCGMKVERFSVFMGKPLISFTRGETEYGVGWLPLGGYVKIAGMVPDEEIAAEDEPRAYYRASTRARIATIFAGPLVNLVVAFLVFAAVAWIGQPTFTLTNTVSSVIESVDGNETPATQLGLQAGDELVSINDVEVSAEAVDESVLELRTEIQDNAGTPVDVVYVRDGERLEGSVAPAVLDSSLGKGQLGFNFQVEEGPVDQAGFIEGFERGGDTLWFLTTQYGELGKRLLVSEEAREQVNGPVGAGAVFDVVADLGFIDILFYIGALSFALGIFNLIPMLPLDGGHIVIALVERVKGSPLSGRTYSSIAVFGLFLVVIVSIYVLQNDIELIRGGDLAERLGRP